jgi:hypothetical protein
MSVRLPAMRDEVIRALENLSDREHQQRVWIEHELPEPDYYDELNLEVHVLFDDIDVCVDPDRWVGEVLRAAEVEPLRALGSALGALIDDLGDAPDADYLADSRWPRIVELAGQALGVMRAPD